MAESNVTVLTRRSFLAFSSANSILAQRRVPPNIVIILADDLGHGDLTCYNQNSKIPTPNMDRIASQGMRFTDAHTPSAVCSPTRYGLLTGRYSWRTRLKLGVLDGFDPPLIDASRLTLPKLLKRHGYSTACVGKWHLGMSWFRKDGTPVPEKSPTMSPARPGDDVDYERPLTGGPNDVGFDTYYGISASLDMSPYCFIDNRSVVGRPNVSFPADRNIFSNTSAGMRTKEFTLEGVLPVFRNKATEFIAKQRGTGSPFFLYMPLSAPHLPIVPNKEFEGRSKAGKYGDFVVEVDNTVGAVMDALTQNGFGENTLLILTSDNGGLWHWWDFQEPDDVSGGRITPRGQTVKAFGHQSNANLRGTKADIWEGGHRVPFLARWPGKIKPASVSSQTICLTDMMATCAAILGAKFPEDSAEDSFSLLPVFRDANKKVREHVILHSHHGRFAIRQGDWKYVPERGSGGFSQPRDITPKDGEPSGQLFNLRLDPKETRNVFAENLQIVTRLKALLEKCQSDGRTRPKSV